MIQETTIKQVACGNACYASFTFIIGMLFYVFTTDETKYGGSDCVMLRNWSYRYGILLLIQAILMLLIIVIFVIAQKKDELSSWTNMVNYFCSFAGLIIWIIIIVAYFQRESCGDLTTLVLVCLWIMIISFAMGLCFVCCAVGASAASG